jgi:hypothetical protein
MGKGGLGTCSPAVGNRSRLPGGHLDLQRSNRQPCITTRLLRGVAAEKHQGGTLTTPAYDAGWT